MKNRFELNEAEKNTIRELHNLQQSVYGTSLLKEDDEDLGSMTSDPSIMAREYGNHPEPTKDMDVAEQIFQLFDHKIAEWTMSPDHRVTQETNQYLEEWKENVKEQINTIVSSVESTEHEEGFEDGLALSGGEVDMPGFEGTMKSLNDL